MGFMKFYSERNFQSSYWNPYSETMPRERIDQLHLMRLKKIIDFAYQNIPMYRRLYDDAGVHPSSIKSLRDFEEKVPVIDKKDFLHAQAKLPAFSQSLAVSEEHLAYYYQTSGSTGAPLKVPFGLYCAETNGEQWAYGLWAAGIRPGDRVYFPFNWGTFVGFWAAYWGAKRLGLEIVSGGGLDTRARIMHMAEVRPTVLMCTPTYALYMAEVAKEMGIDLARSSLRISFHAGEPGANVEATRRAIERALGTKAYEIYGIAEVGSLCFSCPLQGSVHLIEEFSYSIIADRRGRRVGDGEVGENIITSYNQAFQPAIKYRSHDLVRPIYERCECGRTWLRFDGGVLGRSDQMIIIKGTNVYPTAIEALITEVKGLSEHYEIHIDIEGENDSATVKVEAQKGIDPGSHSALARELGKIFRSNIGVRIEAEVLPPNSLPRYELKAKRVFDHRPKARRWQVEGY